MSKLTIVEVQNFLNDFEKNSEITILEEGKEKDELIQIAKAKGLDIEGSRDLAIFKTIYAFADEKNSNGAILPKRELLKILPQIMGKPINKNHDRSRCLGHYIDYRYLDKGNQVITYGVFYKSYFPEEWEEAKKLFKEKKLSSSFEIWSPKDKRENRGDGSYILHKMEIAGGAIIFEDEENQPAFKDAKVLEMSKEDLEKMELVYAKYVPDEIITSKSIVEKSEIKLEEKKEEEKLKTNEITCSNCQEKFEISGLDANVKCPKCFAIVNRQGQMIYPPQIKDFRVLCPSCKVNNWLILSNKEDNSKLKCTNCSKEYEVTFKKKVSSEDLNKLTFLYSGEVRCYQCNTPIVFEGSSKLKQREFKCHVCGLQFSYNIEKSDQYRQMASIQEIEVNTDKEVVKSSEEGGKTMELDKKIEEVKPEVAEEQPKEEVKVEETKVEEKKEEPIEPIAKESSEPVEAPKAEVEEKPKEEIKEDSLPIDIEFEQQFKIEDEYDITISKVIEFAKLNDKIDLELARKKNEKAKQMTYQEKKDLSDDMFAVVITVKNKKTGKTRKIRKYPINDEAHVRNALARLGQEAPKATLEKLGVNIEEVRKKIVARAKKLGMKSLVERYKEKAKVAQEKANELTEVVKKAEEQLTEAKRQVELYKSNAKEIIKRREDLKGYDTELTDEDILNDDKFEKVKLEKENALLKASKEPQDDIIGTQKKNNDYYAKKRAEINKRAGL